MVGKGNDRFCEVPDAQPDGGVPQPPNDAPRMPYLLFCSALLALLSLKISPLPIE